MYLERLLQINIATMAALGTLLFGMGYRSPWLPLGMMTAAITSVWLTDVTGWFRLNRNVATVAAVGAFFFLFWRLLPLRGWLEMLLAIGNFLVCLQIILLFQKKESRTYGLLALLSFVQVVVAAAFRQQLLFGLLLVVYLLVGLSALVLLFLHRERTRHRPAGSRSPAPVTGGRRWPLAGREPIFTDSTGGYAGQAGAWRELRARVTMMALGTLTLALVFFCTFPRWGHNPWRGAGAASLLSVGFSRKVTLGELGKIIENPQEVLRIRFSDGVTGEPYRVVAPVYMRGIVLTHYGQGEWESRPPPGPHPPHPSEFVRFARSRFGVRPVRQNIVIEPMDQQHDLFYVWPFLDARQDQELDFDMRRQRMLRAWGTASRRFPYELMTTAFHTGVQLPLVPAPDYASVGAESLLDRPPAEGPGALPGLVTRAEQWVKHASLSDNDRYACARLLERQLRDSGQFKYSLAGQPRDLSIDPIEDFITNNPRGHCEYFATALTLMLRTRGIPARMVVGFKCDEWNRVGRFFQVRELHAHTWVEAYMEPGQVPPHLLPESWRGKRPAGGWLRLDPTPAAPPPATVNTLLDALGNSFDWLNLVWANYVIEMDRPLQQESIYDPLANAIKEARRRLIDPNWWRAAFNNIGNALGTGLRNLILGLAAVVVVVVLVIGYQVSRILVHGHLWRFARRSDPATRRTRTKVDFYRRLEAVLARFGVTRSASQTQREFARQAAVKIASTPHRQLAELPGQVVEAFYRVRFGGTPLDVPQAEAVEQALKQLKQAVASRRRAVGSGQ